MLWLTPAQDRLFIGPAADRRKFIDRFALAFTADHGANSVRFEKARSERNRLISDGVTDWAWYEAVEADLSKFGALVAQARVLTVQHLQTEIAARATIFPQSLIGLSGTLEDMFLASQPLDFVTDAYRDQLAKDRQFDMRAGRTQIGPHRAEVHVTPKANALPAALCSTGEQKALLIGLILAQARALGNKSPILLLDEIAAHLDEVRRAALAEELIDLNLQVFMTGTDRRLFSDFDTRAQVMHVAEGRLS
jgi:DNA replication and repair protein RecF